MRAELRKKKKQQNKKRPAFSEPRKQETCALHLLPLADASFVTRQVARDPHQHLSLNSEESPGANSTPMTAFYDDKGLEEELSQVNCPEGDLEFDYLFEYEPPCSDVGAGGQGLSEVLLAELDSPPLALSRVFAGSECMCILLFKKKLEQEVYLAGFLWRLVAT